LTALTLIGSPLVASAQAPSLNWGSQVNPSRSPTDQVYRYLEINVTRKVENDVALTNALEVPGTAWADREFNQHIQVWRVGVVNPPGGGAERFCRLVRYQGSFMTTTGLSPEHNDPIAVGIDGSFEGGYLLVFNADELASPMFSTQGHIGTSGGPIGLYDWRSFYFTNMDAGTLQWWGWIYHGGHKSAWVNSFDG